jgi:hypothetical protein
MKGLWLFVLSVGCSTLCQAGQVYKYKGANDNWIFSDKPPEKEQDFSTLQYTSPKKSTSKIKLYNVKRGDGYSLYAKNAKNAFYAPLKSALPRHLVNSLLVKSSLQEAVSLYLKVRPKHLS